VHKYSTEFTGVDSIDNQGVVGLFRFLMLAGQKGHVAMLDWQTKRLITELHLNETIHDVTYAHTHTHTHTHTLSLSLSLPPDVPHAPRTGADI
jgi:hypothetical protein